jgi:hypothetical protein
VVARWLGCRWVSIECSGKRPKILEGVFAVYLRVVRGDSTGVPSSLHVFFSIRIVLDSLVSTYNIPSTAERVIRKKIVCW